MNLTDYLVKPGDEVRVRDNAPGKVYTVKEIGPACLLFPGLDDTEQAASFVESDLQVVGAPVRLLIKI